MKCPNCGNDTDGRRFCTRCGTDLTQYIAPTDPELGRTAPTIGIGRPTATDSPALTSGGLDGKTLDQKYYIESKLGAGGMGTVYRARRLLIGDWVAVKVLHPDQLTDPQAVERFHREAQTAARLKHPNVVSVYDFGVTREGLNYLVTELAEGESLRSLLERRGSLPETEADEIVRQVCAALEEAHRQGVVHRDIKPENILVRTVAAGLQVKALDFGIAALLDVTADKLTRPGAVMGTPHYMSPEHCLGEELDGRSDIYSLGVVLFEMLTGVAPFDSTTPTAIIVKQVNEPPPPPRSLNPKISPAVEAVTLHALEKRREARPQTAGDMARELNAALNNTVPQTPRPTTVITPLSGELLAKKESSRKPALLIFGALLLLVIVACALWWYLRKSGSEKTTENAKNAQHTSTADLQQSTPGPNAAASPSTSPAAPAENKPWELIAGETVEVADAANALGAPNRQMAVIKPGGQLALVYRGGRFFGDGQGDDLIVYGPEQKQISYLVFVRNDPAEEWKRIDINRKGFPAGMAGHDMGHHGIRQARQALIKNIGNTELAIDAASVVYKDQVHVEGATRHRH